MKQLEMTPELSALIKNSVGTDVDTSKLAVFETIALNTKPLPGKRGTIFEKARVLPLTLAQMVDSINSGNHIPLMADHELFGAPKGRAFNAGLIYGDGGIDDLEMRILFYLDDTETVTIAKLNAASLDEVSVQFLSSAFLCSECGWDYFQFSTQEQRDNRTCAHGHKIGTDGVHAELVGLNQFIELSVVARGAADNPKIVGKSDAKLAPKSTMRLAAAGIEPHALVVQASMGKEEEMTVDTTKLMSDLVDAKTSVATLTADVGSRDATIVSLTSARDAAVADVTRLNAELETAKAATKEPEGYAELVASHTEAVALLQGQVQNLLVATGKEKMADDKLPTTVAALKTEIETLTGSLTAILPTGGVSNTATGVDKQETTSLSMNADAFKLR